MMAGRTHVDKAAKRVETVASDQSDYFDNEKAQEDKQDSLGKTGSLWVDTYTSHLYDNMYRASKPGDTVTVVVDEESQASGSGKTKGERKQDHSASITDLGGLMTKLQKIFSALDPTKLIGAKTESKFQGDGSTTRQGKLSARISATVTRVLRNGNLLIKGEQHMKINYEDQILVVEGIIRPYDILPDNTVLSSSLADARISYNGFGVVAEKQKPGWLVRVLDHIWPF